MTKKKTIGADLIPKSAGSGKDEPSFEDFVALVRRKMIENGEDPDAPDIDPLDFSEDEDINPWLNLENTRTNTI